MRNDLKRMAGIALLSTSLLLAACTQTEEAENEPPHDRPDIESITASFEHPETKQKFKIVNAYELYQNYTDTVERNPDQSPLEIYEQEVMEPIYSDCFEGGEYLYMADKTINITPDSLKENQVLSEKMNKRDIEISIKEALFKSSNFLPSESETAVCVLPATDTSAGRELHYTSDGPETDFKDSLISFGISGFEEGASSFKLLTGIPSGLVTTDYSSNMTASSFSKLVGEKIALEKNKPAYLVVWIGTTKNSLRSVGSENGELPAGIEEAEMALLYKVLWTDKEGK